MIKEHFHAVNRHGSALFYLRERRDSEIKLAQRVLSRSLSCSEADGTQLIDF